LSGNSQAGQDAARNLCAALLRPVQLAAQAEVIAMLKSGEYDAIKKDYDAISREYFGRSYFYPEGMSFTKSDALFPPADLAKIIGVEYEGQCKLLCYGPFPRSGPRWVCLSLREKSHCLLVSRRRLPGLHRSFHVQISHQPQ
jgi:hypothetical protein